MIEYSTASVYIECANDLREKIARIDAVITALETTALVAAEKNGISEYWLDDGQIKIKTMYRNGSEVAASIDAFERIKQRYINQLNGRKFTLVDGKNFIRTKYGRR